MLLAAAITPAGQDGGWGHIAALILAGVIAVYAVEAHQWWRRRQGHPSPPPPSSRAITPPPAGTDDPDTDDTDLDDSDDTGDSGSRWGLERIRLADGSTLMRRATAVWRTGSSQLPEDNLGDDGDPGDDTGDLSEYAEDAGETRGEMADRLVRLPVRYSDAVQEIREAFNVSERTAKRDLARAQKRLHANN